MSSPKVLFKPKAGLKIRHPETMEHIPEAGMMVAKTSFFIRRVKDGEGTFESVKVEAKKTPALLKK